ncbi:tRNA3(Ser)-specific nuclease WapA precursor [Pseudoalteromonas sp. P1-9]|nr:tRNA3(Ser)-specific nuclease WapA precursor [Pseudoalteromonas sp. P1-9]
MIAETDSLGSRLKTYLYGDDLISQTDSNNTTNTFHYDGLGSTRLLSSEAGEQSDTYDYLAFGELQNQTGTTDNNYLYTGEQFDGDLDQYYLRARYYDQNVGRFTQQDEWMGRDGEPVTLNKYLYTHADPVNGIDPSGYMTFIGQGVVASRVTGMLSATVRATVKIWSGKNRGKAVKISKQVGCLMGQQFVKNMDGRIEGHHPLQRSIGGQDEQVLLYTLRKTHQMLHTVQNILFREAGLPPLNKGKKYFEGYFSQNPGARRLAFETSLSAARKVDKFCGYGGKRSFEHYLKREIKRWVNVNGANKL